MADTDNYPRITDKRHAPSYYNNNYYIQYDSFIAIGHACCQRDSLQRNERYFNQHGANNYIIVKQKLMVNHIFKMALSRAKLLTYRRKKLTCAYSSYGASYMHLYTSYDVRSYVHACGIYGSCVKRSSYIYI